MLSSIPWLLAPGCRQGFESWRVVGRRYCFYDHVVSVRLMPLSRIVRWTRELRVSAGLEAHDVRLGARVLTMCLAVLRPTSMTRMALIEFIMWHFITQLGQGCVLKHPGSCGKYGLASTARASVDHAPRRGRRSTSSSRRPSTSARCCCWTPPRAPCWRSSPTGAARCRPYPKPRQARTSSTGSHFIHVKRMNDCTRCHARRTAAENL